MRLFRPSGGLLYHLRALRSRTRWRGFCESLEKWLFAWRKPGGILVLIGPSGGYTLPSDWLRGFSKIYAYDIDPLAGWFFRLRHPGLEVEFQQADVFSRNGILSTVAIESLVRRHSEAGFLFCNVLGQLPLEHRLADGELDQFLRRLRKALGEHAWASYHDLFTVEPLAPGSQNNVASAFLGGADIRSGVAGIERLEITDHALGGEWSDGLNRSRLVWPLTSKSLHLIEAVC
jgi:hypothetical protein